MPEFIPWSSQPLDAWAARYARGTFVDVGGRKTHYVEKGEGEPVILLHGFFFDGNMWSENLDALAARFKVYALDLWGCGYSTREPLDYGYALYADQLLRFMDRLGIARASLVGQSMGAGTAIRFCVEHRERVDKLVLVACAGLPNPMPLIGKVFDLRGVGELFGRLKTDMIRKRALRDIFIHDPKRITDRFYDDTTRPQKIAGSLEANLAMTRKRFFDTLSGDIARLARLDVPILLVAGREDRAIPVAREEEMHRILEGSRLEILDDAGHLPNYEQAAKFNRLAVEFLRVSS